MVLFYNFKEYSIYQSSKKIIKKLSFYFSSEIIHREVCFARMKHWAVLHWNLMPCSTRFEFRTIFLTTLLFPIWRSSHTMLFFLSHNICPLALLFDCDALHRRLIRRVQHLLAEWIFTTVFHSYK